MILLALALASPGDLAPGAPELQRAEARLRELLDLAQAVESATARLQVAWTRSTPLVPPPLKKGEARPGPCDDAHRLDVGWRTERFGAAWREAAQAARAQADRVRTIRAAPTVAPLVADAWATRLDDLLAAAADQSEHFSEASAWQARFVREDLARCPETPLVPTAGHGEAPVLARSDPPIQTAVLAIGDGWVCPGGLRADDAVVVVAGALACWDAAASCTCLPTPVTPGAVLGPPTYEDPLTTGDVATGGPSDTPPAAPESR